MRHGPIARQRQHSRVVGRRPRRPGGFERQLSLKKDLDTLNLAKLDAAGLLVEFDADHRRGHIEISPVARTQDGEPKTESMNPFIELTFSEDTENPVRDD